MGTTPPPLTELENYFARTVSLFLEFGGIVLLAMIIIGGYKYLTAGGNPQQTESAKKTLTYAIGGFVLLALSFLILKLIEQFTGVPVTKFKISQ